jgi:hypothetical protein
VYNGEGQAKGRLLFQRSVYLRVHECSDEPRTAQESYESIESAPLVLVQGTIFELEFRLRMGLGTMVVLEVLCEVF